MKVSSVGDKVSLRSLSLHSKLEEAWEGPYEVLEVVSAVNVRIGLPEKKEKTEGCSCEFVVPIP